jgi:tetratricopeptide (TPR) repeat protein
MTLGDLARAEGDLEAAKRQYRRVQSLVGRSGSRHIVEHPLAAEAVRKLGELALAEGSWSEAEHHYRESLAITTRHAEADPGNAALQRDLSAERARLGDLLATIGNLDEAERWLRRAADAGVEQADQALRRHHARRRREDQAK